MMIKTLAHVCFIVKDLEASERFYTEKLGMKKAFDCLRENGERCGLYLHAGGRAFIELFQGEPKSAEGQSYRHLSLEVEDFPATVAELRRRGVELTEPKVGNDRGWLTWTKDPDGNSIELQGYTPESRQAPFLDRRL